MSDAMCVSGALPTGSWDTHCHVFGPVARFPFDPARAFTPNDAPAAELLCHHDRIGAGRAVLVQGSAHGTDHRAMLDAMARAGGRYRGVALVNATVPDDVLAELDEAGVCGARFNLVAHLSSAVDPAAVRRQLARIADRGWHAQVHVTGDQLAALPALFDGFDLPIVIDHMGRIDAADGVEGAALADLIRLLEDARFHVKLSGADRISRVPGWTDAVPIVRRIEGAAPGRVVWGSDWPHANTSPRTSDDELLRFLAEALPDVDARDRVLRRNPAALYGA